MNGRIREKTSNIIINIEIWIATISFLLSIGTSFFESSIYYVSSVVLMIIAAGVHLINVNFKIEKKLLVIMIIACILLTYNFFLNPLATKKLVVYISSFVIGYIVIRDGKNKGVRRLLVSYAIIIALSALYGVFEFVFGNVLDVYTIRVYGAIYRLHSVYLHPIIFSLIMLQSIVIFYYLVDNILLKNIIIMLSVFCVFMTLSRSAWLVLGIVIVLVFCHNKFILKKRGILTSHFSRRKVVIMLILFIALMMLLYKVNVVSYIEILFDRWQALNGSTSVLYRSNVIETVLTDRKNDSNIVHWTIGTGYHSVQKLIGRAGIYFGEVGNNVVDNQWITIFYDFGLLGLGTLVYCTIKSVRLYFSKQTREIWITSLCIIVNFLMAFICDTFEWAPAGNLVFVFLGMMFYIDKRHKVERMVQ